VALFPGSGLKGSGTNGQER